MISALLISTSALLNTRPSLPVTVALILCTAILSVAFILSFCATTVLLVPEAGPISTVPVALVPVCPKVIVPLVALRLPDALTLEPFALSIVILPLTAVRSLVTVTAPDTAATSILPFVALNALPSALTLSPVTLILAASRALSPAGVIFSVTAPLLLLPILILPLVDFSAPTPVMLIAPVSSSLFIAILPLLEVILLSVISVLLLLTVTSPAAIMVLP